MNISLVPHFYSESYLTEEYKAPIFFKNPHIQTIIANKLRYFDQVIYHRERIATPDGDFLELDHASAPPERLNRVVLIAHGLEGTTTRSQYVRGCVMSLRGSAWHPIAWSFRGCSGTPNKQLRSYHCGFTDDLEVVIRYVLDRYKPQEIALIGFSIGGNIVLKYLGERGLSLPAQISHAIAFSVPCDLEDGADTLKRGFNRVYLNYFLRSFKRKLVAKRALFPDAIPENFFEKIKDFEDYDNRFTVPWFGFPNARVYWRTQSCKQFIPSIKVPTTIITSQDDPFFTEASIPFKESAKNPYVRLIVTSHGGHVGYLRFNRDLYWSDLKIREILGDTHP